MFGGSLGQRWNSLTQGQKIFIGGIGVLIIYGLVVMAIASRRFHKRLD